MRHIIRLVHEQLNTFSSTEEFARHSEPYILYLRKFSLSSINFIFWRGLIEGGLRVLQLSGENDP